MINILIYEYLKNYYVGLHMKVNQFQGVYHFNF